METFSALLALCEENSPVNSPHKGQVMRAFVFSLIYSWTNGWVKDHHAGDWRRNRAHYDVTVSKPTNIGKLSTISEEPSHDSAQQLRSLNIGQTSNSRMTPIPRPWPIPRPHGRAMGIYRELFGEKWPWGIGSTLYWTCFFVLPPGPVRCCFLICFVSSSELIPWW